MNGDRQCHSFDRLLSLASRYWPALSQKPYRGMIQIPDYRTIWFCVLLLQRILPKSPLLGHDRGEFQCYLLYRDHLSSITKPHGLPCGSNLDRSEVYKWFWGSIHSSSEFLHRLQFSDPVTVSVYGTRILHNLLFYPGLFLTASRRPPLVRIHRASCLDANRPPFRSVLYFTIAHLCSDSDSASRICLRLRRRFTSNPEAT